MRLVAAVLALMAAPSAIAGPLTPLEADLETLAAKLAGEFDNHAQVTAERTATGAAAHPWVHLAHTPVEVPALGPTVLLAEQSVDGEPGQVVRRHLYSFAADAGANQVVMTIWRLSAAAASAPPQELRALSPDDLDELEGCAVRWRREGAAFVGASAEGECRVTAEESDLVIVLHDLARLDGDLLLLTEWATDPEGNTVYGDPGSDPLQLLRCRWFSGWLSWRDPAAGEPGWTTQNRLRIHDQGGRVLVLDGDGSPSPWELELARVTEPAASVPALRLALSGQGDGSPAPQAVAWSDPGSRSAGLQLPWLRAGFTLVGATPVPSADLRLLVSWMTGSFSSGAQAARDDDFFDIRLHMAPIWSWREDAHWLYVEQAAADALDRPYRQRVYRVSEIADGLFESRVFELPEPAVAVGAWSDPSRLDSLNPAMLVDRPGCAILMRRSGEALVGSTLGSLCGSSLRGASWATSEVTVTRDGLTSWDRGWAADGSQAWGAVKSGYRFDRVEE